MICKIGIKWTTLAALTCKLATVNPPNILPFCTRFYPVLRSQMTLEIFGFTGRPFAESRPAYRSAGFQFTKRGSRGCMSVRGELAARLKRSINSGPILRFREPVAGTLAFRRLQQRFQIAHQHLIQGVDRSRARRCLATCQGRQETYQGGEANLALQRASCLSSLEFLAINTSERWSMKV